MVWMNETKKYLEDYSQLRKMEEELRGSFDFKKLRIVKEDLFKLSKTLEPCLDKEHELLKKMADETGSLVKFMEIYFDARIEYMKNNKGIDNVEMRVYRLNKAREFLDLNRSTSSS